MISIRRLLEKPEQNLPAADILTARSELRGLLLEAITANLAGGLELANRDLDGTVRDLLARLDANPSPSVLAVIATTALRVSMERERRSTGCFREQSEQMQAMIGMLTTTVADISGQSDVSVARLQQVERQIEKATGLDDIRAVKASLESCLTAVKEAAIQQKNATNETVERLRDQIQRAPQHEGWKTEAEACPESRAAQATTEYVAVFKLQRADHILTRFGESTVEQMVAFIGGGLKPIPGPRDRLMRWKGPSFVMLLNTMETMGALRRRLSFAVAKFGQRYVEVGKNSALLAVGVDWVVFPQAQYPSLEAVFAEVDAFLGDKLLRGVASHTE